MLVVVTLRQFRIQHRLTLVALAERLSTPNNHYSADAISKYERDVVEPTVRFIAAFVAVFPEDADAIFMPWLTRDCQQSDETINITKLPTYRMTDKMQKSKIAQFRLGLGLTQKEFCDELKKVGYQISYQYLQKIESGQQPSKPFIKAVVCRFNVNLSMIFDSENKMKGGNER